MLRSGELLHAPIRCGIREKYRTLGKLLLHAQIVRKILPNIRKKMLFYAVYTDCYRGGGKLPNALVINSAGELF